MIIINKPYLDENEKKGKLICDILVNDSLKKIYLEVDKEYEKYLCYERCDAFLIVLFFYAMRENMNIECKGLVTEDLYYQITEYLIPLFAKNSHNKLKKIRIKAKLASNIENIGAVGTGFTRGVDSFYSVVENIKHKVKRNRLTHLMIMSLADSYKVGDYKKISDDLYNRGLLVSKKLNLPIIRVNSNMREVFPIPPMHTLIRMFGVYALQKLFGVYYFSSGYPIWTFNLEDCSLIDSARYDLLICKELSTKNLTIYSHGSQVNRIDKIKKIAKYDLVRKNLHVCIHDSVNCSKCSKCIRTMAGLDSINKLDEFREVFDVDYYYNNLDEYLRKIVNLYQHNDLFIYEYIDLLRKKYRNKEIFKKIDYFDSKFRGICTRCYRISDYKLLDGKKKRIIGVSGSSSSGKSTVVEFLKNNIKDSYVINVDKYMIKYLDVYKKEIITKLNIPDDGRHWCNYIYNNYSDVETWINILKNDIQREITIEKNNCVNKNIIVDSFMLPLLDIFNECDYTIAVDSDIKHKLSRVKYRLTENGRIKLFDDEALKKRITYTGFDHKYIFDYKITNNSTKDVLLKNVNEIIRKIQYFD